MPVSQRTPTPVSPDHEQAIELFDVVDRNDRVISQASRAYVHANGLLHRAIHIFIFNENGELFLQRRAYSKDSAPGTWVSSCSGHVDAGEDYDTAARRELAEELGVNLPLTLRPVFHQTACRETGNEFVWLYRTEYDGPFALDPDEIIEGQWIQPEALNRWIAEKPRDFAWSFTFLWDRYLQHGYTGE